MCEEDFSHGSQLIAKHIKKFIEPDSSAKEALPRVKKFLKEQPLSPTAAKGAKGNGPALVTDQFYTYWQDEFLGYSNAGTRNALSSSGTFLLNDPTHNKSFRSGND